MTAARSATEMTLQQQHTVTAPTQQSNERCVEALLIIPHHTHCKGGYGLGSTEWCMHACTDSNACLTRAYPVDVVGGRHQWGQC